MNDLPIPMSRIECYLATAAGMAGVTLPEAPESRLEDFLAYIAGDTSIELPTPMSLTELWLNYVAGGALTDEMKLEGAYYIGGQKVDVRFFAVAGGMEGVTAPAPQNRTEQYWARIAETRPVHGVLTYATGTNIVLTDVVRGIASLENIYGDTTQQSYTGKNLFNYQAVNNLALSTTIVSADSYRGYSLAAQAGQTFTMSRLATGGNNRFRVAFTIVEPAIGVTFYGEDGTANTYKNYDSALSGTFTVPEGMNYVFVYLSDSGQTISEDLQIQIELGSSVSSYEPYVGSTASQITPSPNPDYPQDVNVVTGEQTVDVHGKNLFNLTSLVATNITVASGVANGTATAFYNAWKNGITLPPFTGQLSLSAIAYTDGNSSTSNVAGLKIRVVYTDGTNADGITWNNSDTSAVSKTYTTDASKTVSYIAIVYQNTGSNIWHLSDFQIEQSASPTTYEHYQGANYTIDLGSTELCKIGTYQDYIYKSGDDWYIHKDTKKVVYNGSENWVTRTGKSHTFQISISTSIRGISNYFTNITSASFDIAPGMYAGNSIFLIISYPDMADVTTLKTWLGTHNLVFYEILSVTPADTKITDSTLISQLNALGKATLPKPVAYLTVGATSPNLPASLKISYYAEEE